MADGKIGALRTFRTGEGQAVGNGGGQAPALAGNGRGPSGASGNDRAGGNGAMAPAVAVPRAPSANADLLRASAKFREFMEALGLDTMEPHLEGTALRVARAYRELFAGLRPGAEPELRSFANEEGYSGVVAVTDIPFYSLCAHHFLPFFGVVHVGYVPGARVVGLSKLARVVEHFARRPQVQERLTQQVASFIAERLDAAGVMVVVEARHLCMEMRGIGKPKVLTRTSSSVGAFAHERLRREFRSLLGRRGTARRRRRKSTSYSSSTRS